MAETTEKATRIRELNDEFRANPLKTGPNNRVVFTHGVSSRSHEELTEILEIVKSFGTPNNEHGTKFDHSNGPWEEHDFGAFEYAYTKFFWKIDYYNNECTFGSDDPGNSEVTCRVLTVMQASEY